MPTLSDLVYARDKTLTCYINIGGRLIIPTNPTSPLGTPGQAGVTVSKSLEQPVPRAAIKVNRIPTWLKRGMAVTIDAGYNGLTQRIFTGFVQDRAHAMPESTINCFGYLYSAFRTVQMTARNVDGKTVTAAIGEVLDYAGITNRSITDTCPDQAGPFTLGTNSNPVLQAMPLSQMLQMLMDVDGLRIYELASGSVVVQYLDERPAANAFRSYSTTNQPTAVILSGSDREDPNFTRTEVDVTGASIPAVGNTPASTITGKATVVGGSIIVPPLPTGTTLPASYSNFLIDTNNKAGLVAARLLSKFNRVPRQFTLEIEGDPLVELTQTIGCTFDLYSVDGNFFLYGIEHTIDQSGFKSRLDLRGGDEFGGTIDISPVASFTWKAEQELIGSTMFTIVTFDASTSFDPDGTIASYAWSDNQTTTPEIATITTKTGTVKINPATASGDWNVTLTVTDNLGGTASVTQKIEYAASSTAVVIPTLFTSLDTVASCTPDGAQTWIDQVKSGCISVAPRPGTSFTPTGVCCWGFNDGSIWKSNNFLNDALVQVLAPVGSPMVAMEWDWRNELVVWALTLDMRLYVSLDSGATFGLYDNLRSVFVSNVTVATGTSIGLPADGGVWVFGGDNVGQPLTMFDGAVNHGWTRQAVDGDLGIDYPVGGGGGSVAVVMTAAPSNFSAAMILKNAAAGKVVYYSSSGNPLAPAWQRATGFGSLTQGRFIVMDFLNAQFHAGFDNRDVYHTLDGINYTATTNVFPANAKPWDAYFFGLPWILAGVAGTYAIALEDTVAKTFGIYKSIDGLQTVGAIRPVGGLSTWPTNAIGRQIRVARPPQSQLGALYAQLGKDTAGPSSYNPKVLQLGINSWSVVSNPGSASHGAMARLQWLSPAFYRIEAKVLDVGNMVVCGQLQRSTDAISWANVGPTPAQDGDGEWWGCTDVCMAADGTIYASYSSINGNGSATGALPGRIYRSVDQGLTFPSTLSPAVGAGGIVLQGAGTPNASGYNHYCFLHMTAHPNDPLKIVMVADHFPGLGPDINYTLDGAQSWGVNGTSHGNSIGHQRSAVFTDSGRLILDVSRYSDDYGQNETNASGGASFGNYLFDIVVAPGGVIFAAGGTFPNGTALNRSLDNGVTYHAMFGEAALNGDFITALAYDPVADKLYIATEQTSSSPTGIWLYVINNASVSDFDPGTAQNATFDIVAKIGGGGTPIGPRAIALKPAGT